MPKFTAENLGPLKSTFGFSAVDINSLGATEYTLVGLVVDCSGSVSGFRKEEEAAIKEIVAACRKSPRADNLMLRYTLFDSRVMENHGFKLLMNCNPSDYDGTIPSGGATALFDAAVDGVDALARYGDQLQKNDMNANAILFIITDGANCAGTMTANEVKKAVDRARKSEHLESITTILIGVNLDPNVSGLLADFVRDAGLDQFVNIGDANQKTLARLAAFVSKSISSTSQALGTGGPSQTLPTF